MIPRMRRSPQIVKSAARAVAARICEATPWLARRLEGKALVLMYHRVLPPEDAAAMCVQPGMYVTPQTFDRHLRFLRTHFELLSFTELLRRWRGGTWNDSARSCVLTFDDGWVDNYRYAFPLLLAYDAPATIFLPTELIGTAGWPWPDRLGYLLHRSLLDRRAAAVDVDLVIERAKAWPDTARERVIRALAADAGIQLPRSRCFLDWEEVREMGRHGVEFGSHTSTHAILTRLDRAALEVELKRPHETLASRCDQYLPVLCYPNGDHSEEVVTAARAAGYLAAVTTNPGVESRRPDDLFRLRRVGLHEDVARTVPLLALHLARQACRS